MTKSSILNLSIAFIVAVVGICGCVENPIEENPGSAVPDAENPNARYAAPLQQDGGMIPIDGVWGTKGGSGTRGHES